MIRFWAIIENTFREGIAKKTILTILILTTVIIGFFLLALNVSEDVLYIFGQEIDEIPEEVIRGIEAVVTAFFYQVSIFVGIFAIAAFYPSMQEKGTIDLLLSRPMSRFNIFTAKFIGCMLVVLLTVAYLVLGTWVVIWMKTGFAHVEYLTTIPIFMLQFFAFMSFIAMVAIFTRNTTTSAILAIFIPFIFSAILYGFHRSSIMDGNQFWGGFFETLYNIFPKIAELTQWNIEIISGSGNILGRIDLPFAILTTIAFSAFCYIAGATVFHRRSY